MLQTKAKEESFKKTFLPVERGKEKGDTILIIPLQINAKYFITFIQKRLFTNLTGLK